MTINLLHIRDTGDMLGAENVILELSKNGIKYNINPIIGVLGNVTSKLGLLAEQHRIKTVNIPCKSKLDFTTIRFLRQFIIEHNIHIVHAHGYKEDFYAWQSKSTPIIATNHLWKRTTVSLRLYAYIDAKILNRFDKVVAVSKPIQQEIIESGVSASKITLIQNGIDVEKYDQQTSFAQQANLKQALKIPSDRIIIGMISSLTKEKGHEKALIDLARTLSAQPLAQILIVGSGPEEKRLREIVHSLNIESNVTFAGSRQDIPSLLSIIDIFLLYSKIEGLPMALLEAMAAGKAIIATNVGDVSSAIINNKTGILLSGQKKNELCHDLSALLNNSTLREALGNAAKSQATELFSSATMTEKYINLYNELLK